MKPRPSLGFLPALSSGSLLMCFLTLRILFQFPPIHLEDRGCPRLAEGE